MKHAATAIFLVAMVIAGRSAFAQRAAGAAAPVPDLAPPTALDAGHVAYPLGAQGDAAVVLEVVVEQDGRVGDARVVRGQAPFASAALDAARAWTFVPARRAGEPVSARIRVQVDFRAPVPVGVAGPPNARAPGSPVPSRSSPDAQMTEVIVRGTHPEVGETKIGGAEVRQLPGAFGDAFRAIEALPGVTPIVSGLPFFFVRGAPPGNIGYFIDGVRVPLLYHLALGPSVVHPSLIDHVDFFPGGYPARFGRYAGGILDGGILPAASRVHGEASVRVFDSGALVEAPMLDGRLTALVAGRYSYTAALVQIVAKDTRVGYWDYQTRVAYDVTPSDRVSVFWFGSFDEIDSRSRESTYDQTGRFVGETVGDFYPVFKTEFHRLDLRYDHDTPRGQLRLAATLGVEDSLAGSGQTQRTSVIANSVALRTEGQERLSAATQLRYGADVLLYHYSIDTGQIPGLDVRSLYPDRNDVMAGAYSDVVWKASNRVEVVPGIRIDVFTSRLASAAAPPVASAPAAPPNSEANGPLPGAMSSATAAVGVDPRLATRVAASRRATWVTTFGVSHQPPSLFVPVPGLTLGRLNGGLQTSLQTSQGFELTLPADILLTATAFLHQYLGLTDATATCLGNGSDLSKASNDCLAERVRGRSYGVELLARRDLTKRLTGWVSYTLSRTTRETRGLIAPETLVGLGAGGQSLQEIPSEFDRTHVLNVIGALDLGRGWRAGARLVAYTGRPYSPQIHGVPVPPFDSLRLPSFYRFDVRLEKRWRAFGSGYLAFVVEGMNVMLAKEAIDVVCQGDGSILPLKYDTCAPQYIGPVTVPSLGLEGGI